MTRKPAVNFTSFVGSQKHNVHIIRDPNFKAFKLFFITVCECLECLFTDSPGWMNLHYESAVWTACQQVCFPAGLRVSLRKPKYTFSDKVGTLKSTHQNLNTVCSVESIQDLCKTCEICCRSTDEIFFFSCFHILEAKVFIHCIISINQSYECGRQIYRFHVLMLQVFCCFFFPATIANRTQPSLTFTAGSLPVSLTLLELWCSVSL